MPVVPKMTTKKAILAIIAFFASGSLASGVSVCNNLPYQLQVYNVPGSQPACAGIQTSHHPIDSCTCHELPWTPLGCGVSIKASKDFDLTRGIVQFEYTRTEFGAAGSEMSFDISDVDGGASGVAGSAFLDAHIVARADGEGAETCNPPRLECEFGKVCADAYRYPTDDVKMRTCAKRADRWVIEINNPNGGCKANPPLLEQQRPAETVYEIDVPDPDHVWTEIVDVAVEVE
ncbi:uncharacterized protein LY89DRAFT_664593 [Mollisia scopiformis]|uniref:Secreted protein n=1 Tax=Mollisia scopiformis TaxID=149040 RepID=A0A194XRN0_MOLSC|nr:uncharacterized protein LY89DRAFT_664593 [Mollisia scopiformis]KUJ22806.1 hypothetical protein LY89DRAFT_664593 [Mollisia scopiformis]